jgi:hypothetical protein
MVTSAHRPVSEPNPPPPDGSAYRDAADHRPASFYIRHPRSSPIARVGIELSGKQPIREVVEPTRNRGRLPGEAHRDLFARHAEQRVAHHITIHPIKDSPRRFTRR